MEDNAIKKINGYHEGTLEYRIVRAIKERYSLKLYKLLRELNCKLTGEYRCDFLPIYSRRCRPLYGKLRDFINQIDKSKVGTSQEIFVEILFGDEKSTMRITYVCNTGTIKINFTDGSASSVIKSWKEMTTEKPDKTNITTIETPHEEIIKDTDGNVIEIRIPLLNSSTGKIQFEITRKADGIFYRSIADQTGNCIEKEELLSPGTIPDSIMHAFQNPSPQKNENTKNNLSV